MDSVDFRVLVVAPTGRDAELLTKVLAEGGFECCACATIANACKEAEQGVAAFLLAEEALGPAELAKLDECLDGQPEWSDLPVLILVAGGRETMESAARARQRANLQHKNVTLLERPIRMSTLISAVEAALRARTRQYEIRANLEQRATAQEAVRRSEKLAVAGRLAASIAHEINNPLESVTNLLYLARSDQTLSSDTRTYLATAEQELARLGDITRLTLGFVRTSATRPSMPAEEVIEDVLKIFRQRLESKQVQVERRFEPGVEVHIAAHELRQIVTNLVSNAVDAMNTPGGRLRVSIAREETAIAIAIEDDGSGIAPSQLQRIFDPFFTTKEDVGTGIGLWVTRELVETNGGQILAESGDLANGMKTRFRVELPIPTGVETMSQRAVATQTLHPAGR
jgi:signal transduction histidine kinase